MMSLLSQPCPYEHLIVRAVHASQNLLLHFRINIFEKAACGFVLLPLNDSLSQIPITPSIPV